MTTTEGNKILMDFLGWEKVDDETYRFPSLYPIYDLDEIGNTGWITDNISNAMFHKSWDWIMKVVEKMESLSTPLIERVWVSINGKECGIWTYFDAAEALRKNIHTTFKAKHTSKTKIQAVWLACVDFCKWYEINKNDKQRS